VRSFSYVKTLDEAINALERHKPVILGTRLTPNFYHNKGLVLQSEKDYGPKKLNSHSKGHAVLLVGYMKLPPNMHEKEGKVCFLTANSWGVGWAKGGHSCLSEKWVKEHRRRNPFVVVESVKI
jgi:C1A family cysteine protease